MRTKQSQRLTLLQGGAGVGESGSASTIYGPVRAGLTTSHKIQNHQLSESLSELERKISDLESRYLEVLGMWITASEHLVKLLPTIKEMDTTDEWKV